MLCTVSAAQGMADTSRTASAVHTTARNSSWNPPSRGLWLLSSSLPISSGSPMASRARRAASSSGMPRSISAAA